MTSKEIVAQLSKMGSATIKNVFMKHGAPEPLYGVKVGDLKTIEKKVKRNHELALELFDTGNSDAMYLAGLISEPKKMTKKQLEDWAEKATWYMLSEFAVAWSAAESPFALELAQKWIKSKKEMIACTGWATYSNYIALTPDADLDKKELESLLYSIGKDIHKAPNRVRHCMNNFVISVGGYVSSLTDHAKKTAKSYGVVTVDMGDTACKVPEAISYMDKMIARGSHTKKKKTVKC